MKAVLYVGHGTRVKRGVEEAISFLEETKRHVPIAIQEIAFLELVEPDIVEGVKRCVERGATQIAIVPLLLLTAQHAKEDIPEEVEKAKQLYPYVQFSIGRPFGIHEHLIDTVYERIVEQQVDILPDAEVLLVGRGSSDGAVIRDMREISRRLQTKYHFANVRACFLYGTGPSFEATLQSLKEQQTKQIFIVPYLLFSGLLSIGIEKKVKELQFDESRIKLCNSLGYNDRVRHVLKERVSEAVELLEGALAYA